MTDFSRDRFDIARIHVSRANALASAYEHATRVSSQALHVKRVSIWFFEDDRRVLRCAHLHDASPTDGKPDIRELHAKDFPAYVHALETSRWVCADDARNDPSTKEFRDIYLDPLGITSMLDAPIMRNGRLAGVVCHEHVGAKRTWTEDERAFAGSVADVVALFLEQAQRLDAERLAAVGRLAVSVAHDVNNLLAAVDGLVAVATRAPDEKARADALDEVRRTTARGVALMRRLLAFGRGEEGALESVDAAAVLRASEVMLHTLVRDKADLRVAVSVPSAIVLATPMHLEQIVMNLVVNARDALPRGGHIVVSLDEETVGSDRYYALAVRDDGVGMDDATRARVFEPFFTTKSDKAGGTGLGLSTVYGLTRQMNGEVRIESTVGKGTTVTVLIPVP